jgi:hypothetical protein
MQMVTDIDAAFERFGGRRELAELVDMTLRNMRNWHHRRVFPLAMREALEQLAADRGFMLDPALFSRGHAGRPKKAA